MSTSDDSKPFKFIFWSGKSLDPVLEPSSRSLESSLTRHSLTLAICRLDLAMDNVCGATQKYIKRTPPQYSSLQPQSWLLCPPPIPSPPLPWCGLIRAGLSHTLQPGLVPRKWSGETQAGYIKNRALHSCAATDPCGENGYWLISLPAPHTLSPRGTLGF